MAGIELYQHPIGPERGHVHLVINCPGDPESKRLICSSEKSKDFGVVFTIDIDEETYHEMCADEDIETLEGCVMATYGDQIELQEIPEESPPPIPEKAKAEKNNLRVLTNPNMWRHKWGRCCCVQRGNEVTPVTPETLAEGDTPWWTERYTPFQLDLIQAANSPEDKAMHLLVDEDRICGKCEHYVWTVYDEDMPDELPEPPEDVEGDEPLCIDQEALSEIPWRNKKEAWDCFYEDPHNRKIIKESKLPVERANQRQKYSHEYSFEAINRQTKRKVCTIKQAFYFALGATQKGTWGDFNLEAIRSVEHLEDLDIPAEILDQVELDDEADNDALHQASANRYVKRTVDDEADELEAILDEEAGLDVPAEFLEEEEVPEVVEPTKQKSSAVKKPSKKFKRHSRLVEATKKLRDAIDVFLAILEEEEDEEEDEEDQRAGT